MRERLKKGSFTVEASILVPFLLFVIMVFLCLCMYLHDRSVLAANAAELAGKGSMMKYQRKEALEEWLLEQAYEVTGDRLLAVTEFEAYVEVTDKEVLVGYTGETGMLGGLKIREEERARRLMPVLFIRDGRRIQGLVKGEKDASNFRKSFL